MAKYRVDPAGAFKGSRGWCVQVQRNVHNGWVPWVFVEPKKRRVEAERVAQVVSDALNNESQENTNAPQP